MNKMRIKPESETRVKNHRVQKLRSQDQESLSSDTMLGL